MGENVIEVRNISKQYRLGKIGAGTLSHDLQRWWARMRGKPDPFRLVGERNLRDHKSENDYVWALRDISFDVKRGEVLGIIGRNGAGKSTLLKILSQVTEPTHGSIRMNGRVASLLEVGTGFHPDLSGRENIFLNGAILGMSKTEIRSKFDEIVEFAGVARYLDTPVKRYSSGMKVRLGFAVAAHLEPEILIVDEVLAVGDAEFQEKCIGKMNKVAKSEGVTVLFVSHNMVSVMNLCTRGLVIDSGNIIFEGDQNKSVDFYLSKAHSEQNIKPIARKDRTGSGEIRLAEIRIMDDKNVETPAVISGRSCTVSLRFEVFAAMEEKLFLGINIFDSTDYLVSFWASDEIGLDVNRILQKKELDVKIPRMLLRGGEYYFNIFLSKKANHSAEHEVVDMLSNACKLRVLEGDFWDTGVVNRRKGTIIPCSFE